MKYLLFFRKNPTRLLIFFEKFNALNQKELFTIIFQTFSKIYRWISWKFYTVYYYLRNSRKIHENNSFNNQEFLEDFTMSIWFTKILEKSRGNYREITKIFCRKFLASYPGIFWKLSEEYYYREIVDWFL